MKITDTSNRGATLIELIASIAILSILGVSCFTLLMFSIKTNNFILTGTDACRDAEVLNERLEVIFKDAVISYSDDSFDGSDESGPATAELQLSEIENESVLAWKDSQLLYNNMLIQDDVSDFGYEFIEGTNLICITYRIDDRYTSTKIFVCEKCSKTPPAG